MPPARTAQRLRRPAPRRRPFFFVGLKRCGGGENYAAHRSPAAPRLGLRERALGHRGEFGSLPSVFRLRQSGLEKRDPCAARAYPARACRTPRPLSDALRTKLRDPGLGARSAEKQASDASRRLRRVLGGFLAPVCNICGKRAEPKPPCPGLAIAVVSAGRSLTLVIRHCWQSFVLPRSQW